MNKFIEIISFFYIIKNKILYFINISSINFLIFI